MLRVQSQTKIINRLVSSFVAAGIAAVVLVAVFHVAIAYLVAYLQATHIQTLGHFAMGSVQIDWGIADWVGIIIFTIVFWALAEGTDAVKILRLVLQFATKVLKISN